MAARSEANSAMASISVVVAEVTAAQRQRLVAPFRLDAHVGAGSTSD